MERLHARCLLLETQDWARWSSFLKFFYICPVTNGVEVNKISQLKVYDTTMATSTAVIRVKIKLPATMQATACILPAFVF
jgi:hypothetical protein